MNQPKSVKAPFIALGSALYLFSAQRGPLTVFIILFILSGFGILLLVHCYLKRQRNSGGHRKGLRLARDIPLVMVGGFLLLMLSQNILKLADSRANLGLAPEKIQSMKVVLLYDPSIVGLSHWFTSARILEVAGHNMKVSSRGRVHLSGRIDPEGIAAGQELSIEGVLKGNTADGWRFYVKTLHPGPYRHFLLRWRAMLLGHLIVSLERSSRDTFTFLSALILGRQIDPGSPVIINFRNAGCIHLLALSGFHIGIIAVFLSCVLKPILGLRITHIAVLLAVLFYLFLVGIRPSLLRAVLMYGFWTFDRIRGRQVRPLNYLSMAFVLQCLLFPRTLYSLSFRLSYTALAGILVCSPYLSMYLRRFLPVSVAGTLAVGIGAQAATLPVVVGAFGIWRPISILAAPVLTPLVALTMITGTALLIMPESRAMPGMVWMLDTSVQIMNRSAGLFSRFPALSITSALLWPLTLIVTLAPLFHRSRNRAIEPQLPSLNPGISGIKGNSSP